MSGAEVSGLLLHVVLPFAAIGHGGLAAAMGLLTYTFIVLAYAANRRVTQVSPWAALLFAPAVTVLAFALARSATLTLARGGVEWRGTRYPLDELRRGGSPW